MSQLKSQLQTIELYSIRSILCIAILLFGFATVMDLSGAIRNPEQYHFGAAAFGGLWQYQSQTNYVLLGIVDTVYLLLMFIFGVAKKQGKVFYIMLGVYILQLLWRFYQARNL